MTYLTAGEQLVHRALTSTREGGAPHYLPGQHKAALTDPELLRELGIDDGGLAAELSYVDNMGHAVLVLCLKEKGDTGWTPLMAGRAGHSFFEGWKGVGADEGEVNLVLSPKMRAALDEAERRLR